jgi:tetratricopeptide (TPR) repeat protein
MRGILTVKPFVISAAVYLLVAIVLTQVPLFNYLGYEFSAAMGLLGGLIAGINTIAFFKGRVSSIAQRPVTLYTRVLRLAATANLAILLLPFIIITLNALFVKNCSITEGLKFYLLIPVFTVVFASALGALCFILFRKKPMVWYIVLYTAYLLYALYVGYSTPQVFIYNHIIGFFPGFTYDESLSVSGTLVLYRALTLLLSLAILCVWRTVIEDSNREDALIRKVRSLVHISKNRTAFLLLLLSLCVLTGAYWSQGKLGISSTANFVQQELGSKFETDHFIIYYSSNVIDEQRIKWVASEHEFRLYQITRLLGTTVSGKISSYIYPSAEVKKRLIGAGGTNISKPWRREIHINYESLDASLKHELVHATSSELGIPVLNVSPLSGLTEGLAMAVEWDWGSRTLHEYAAGMKQLNLMRDINSLLSVTGFMSQASSVSYVLCGSFCRFLMDTYGVERFKQVYRYGNFEKVYGKSLNDLQTEWMSFLSTIPVAPTERTALEFFFKRPSIFQKVCARVIANLNAEAWENFQSKNYHLALPLFSKSFGLSENQDARMGLILSHLRLGNCDTVIVLTAKALQDTTIAYPLLKLYQGDAYWTKGNLEAARADYRQLYQAHLSLNVDEVVLKRLETLQLSDVQLKMQKYFVGGKDETVRVLMLKEVLEQHPTFDVGKLMLGEMLSEKREYQQSLHYLQRIQTTLANEFLEAMKEKIVGIDYFYLKDFPNARAHFQKALEFVHSQALLNEVQDCIERCDWMMASKNDELIL